MKKVSVATFGCKVNQYESACILNDFRIGGFETVPFPQEAEVYVINTCTVTGRTDYKSRNAIRHALKRKELNRSVKIIVTGCYSQLHKEKILSMGEIDLIVDNNNKDLIYTFLKENRQHFTADVNEFKQFREQRTNSLFERVRAFVKIQDGCDYFCTYCAVPLARGLPRSREPDRVIAQIREFADNGYQEIVLTGVNLGLYGRDFTDRKSCSLADLLTDIERIERIKQIRLSSLEPQLISSEIVSFLKNSTKICPHLHIPLQSGSDEILTKMGRPYKTDDFFQLLMSIRDISPHIAIGSDLIVGFPGETEKLFKETFSFIEKLPLAYLHIFPYSRRPGTKAAEMTDIPPSAEVRQRCSRISDLMKAKKDHYFDHLIQNNVVLSGIPERIKGSYRTALSNHYVRIYSSLSSVGTGFKNPLEMGDLLTGKAKRKIFDGLEIDLKTQ